MNKNIDHIDELIASVLSGNAGAQECAALKEWTAESNDHHVRSTSFAVSDRNVQLEGEGYFGVTQNKALPFEVRTPKLNVKTTGTAFNVKVYSNDSIVETILAQGRVYVMKHSYMA